MGKFQRCRTHVAKMLFTKNSSEIPGKIFWRWQRSEKMIYASWTNGSSVLGIEFQDFVSKFTRSCSCCCLVSRKSNNSSSKGRRAIFWPRFEFQIPSSVFVIFPVERRLWARVTFKQDLFRHDEDRSQGWANFSWVEMGQYFRTNFAF